MTNAPDPDWHMLRDFGNGKISAVDFANGDRLPAMTIESWRSLRDALICDTTVTPLDATFGEGIRRTSSTTTVELPPEFLDALAEQLADRLPRVGVYATLRPDDPASNGHPCIGTPETRDNVPTAASGDSSAPELAALRHDLEALRLALMELSALQPARRRLDRQPTFLGERPPTVKRSY